MADDHGTQRMEIAKRFLGDRFQESHRIPYDEEEHSNLVFHVELAGSPKSWILLDCPNRLVDRYDTGMLPWNLEDMKKEKENYPLYVGIDACSLHPVFMHVEAGDKTPGGYRDLYPAKFRTFPECESNHTPHVVLHECLLKKGALKFTRRVAMGDPETLRDIGRTAWSVFLAQARDVESGVPVQPFEHPKHRDLPISHSIIEYDEVYKEMKRPYMLRLPCLTKATLTPRLFELATELQRVFSQDNISLNEIIMAIFVWCNHKSDPNQRVEGFPTGDDISSGTDLEWYGGVSRVGLVNFVAIWPHYLRFHEIHKLATYIHPLRFVESLAFTVSDAHRVTANYHFHDKDYSSWEDMAVREVALSGLCETEWKVVVPASLRGSILKSPTRWRFHEANIEENFALPDINMIGHPAYPVGGSTFTRVVMPLPWVNSMVNRTQSWVEAQGKMVLESSVLTQRGMKGGEDYDTLRLICGDQLSVFAPPRPLEPTDDPFIYKVADGETEGEGELHPAKIFEALSSVEESEWRKKAFETRISMARESGITIEALGVDELGLPTWPGIAACVVARLKRGPPST